MPDEAARLRQRPLSEINRTNEIAAQKLLRHNVTFVDKTRVFIRTCLSIYMHGNSFRHSRFPCSSPGNSVPNSKPAFIGRKQNFINAFLYFSNQHELPSRKTFKLYIKNQNFLHYFPSLIDIPTYTQLKIFDTVKISTKQRHAVMGNW